VGVFGGVLGEEGCKFPAIDVSSESNNCFGFDFTDFGDLCLLKFFCRLAEGVMETSYVSVSPNFVIS
jgi:hypothetical protein